VPRKASPKIVRRHPSRFRVDEEIELRVLTQAHAGPLFAITNRNRGYLRRWLPWVDGTRTARDTSKFIRGGRRQLLRNDGFQAGIWYRGELVGAIGYHYWNWAVRKTEIGYWLAEPFQGKGIATRAVRTLVDHAFRDLGMDRVEIRAAAGNARSYAIAERLGFTREGTLRGAEYSSKRAVDQVVYGLIRGEWKPRSS